MALDLPWMPANAPYMPIATIGLLAVLDENDVGARAYWSDGLSGLPSLKIDIALDVEEVAQLIASTPWPRLASIGWRGGSWSQGLKPTLKSAPRPAQELRALIAGAEQAGHRLEAKLLRSILTDGMLDADGVPGRSRLLRGVKSDLTSISDRPKRITAEGLAGELRDGPDFVNGKSGLGLGLVPEVQTFGGTTGPDASSVGAHSKLLYLLLWLGIMALPPIPVVRGPRRVVGGPLVTAPDVLSWPRWRIPAGIRSLRTMLCLAAIHEEAPDMPYLRERGIDAVYRARAIPLNNMVAVFRWAERIG
ncbi:MAG: hypothetical protein ACYCUM_11660 [Solirubrobacteraceae bacterium]